MAKLIRTTGTTRRQLLQSGSALALAGILPRCAATRTKAPLQPVAFADIPRSDYGFATTCDEVIDGFDLRGKTVLITGCNSGLGLESLRVLAGAGADVIGTVRTEEKAREVSEMARDGQWLTADRGSISTVVCELTDMDSVADCANQVGQTLTLGRLAGRHIDVLMCNAGIMALPEREVVDVGGVPLEKQFVVNHLGHYLLTRKLLPQILPAAEPRIVNVSSFGYTIAPEGGIRVDDLAYAEGYQAFKAYGQTKLANILFTHELDRRYFDAGVTANSIHPGLVATNLGRYMRGDKEGTSKRPDRPLRKGQKSAAQGAATQVYVAADSRLAGVSGYYFADCNPVALEGPYAEDGELALSLWDASAELVAAWL